MKVLHTRRPGGLSHRARRELYSVIDSKTFTEDSHHHAQRSGHADLLARRRTLHLLVLQPETDVVSVADHKIIAKVKQESPFCPNIAAAEGSQVWFTLKDVSEHKC